MPTELRTQKRTGEDVLGHVTVTRQERFWEPRHTGAWAAWQPVLTPCKEFIRKAGSLTFASQKMASETQFATLSGSIYLSFFILWID